MRDETTQDLQWIREHSYRVVVTRRQRNDDVLKNEFYRFILHFEIEEIERACADHANAEG